MSLQFQPSDPIEEKIFWDTELDVNSFSSSYFKATQRELHKRNDSVKSISLYSGLRNEMSISISFRSHFEKKRLMCLLNPKFFVDFCDVNFQVI